MSEETQDTSLTKDFFHKCIETFEADPKNLLAQNVATTTDLKIVLLDRKEMQILNQSFKVQLPDVKITDQKRSGRCWLFSVTNVMRRKMITKYNLPNDFELSQSYLFFYDKLEKCNWFLENIIDTIQEDLNGRLLAHLLTDPTCDGGQWDMIVNVVEKYGIVPKSVYPESISSSESYVLNQFVKSKLREYAKSLRTMYYSGKVTKAQLRQEKIQMMNAIYHCLLITLGKPPSKFTWKQMQKDKKGYLCYKNLTPLSFYYDFVPMKVTEYVSLVNDPRNPYLQTLTVERLGNVQEGKPVLYLNCDISSLWNYAAKSLDAGESVWFGCDVGKDSNMKKIGIMSTSLLNYELLFNMRPLLKKKERLMYGESLMTHAMVFTGYDMEEETPFVEKTEKEEEEATGGKVQAQKEAPPAHSSLSLDTLNITTNGKETSSSTTTEDAIVEAPKFWRVENSWGEDRSDRGYDIMTRDWFNEYVYQVVVKYDDLDEKHKEGLKKKPIVLPPWDPMGSLARDE